jgi:hypothetical protein
MPRPKPNHFESIDQIQELKNKGYSKELIQIITGQSMYFINKALKK